MLRCDVQRIYAAAEAPRSGAHQGIERRPLYSAHLKRSRFLENKAIAELTFVASSATDGPYEHGIAWITICRDTAIRTSNDPTLQSERSPTLTRYLLFHHSSPNTKDTGRLSTKENHDEKLYLLHRGCRM